MPSPPPPAPTDPVAALASLLERSAGRFALYPPPREFRRFGDAEFVEAVRLSNGDPIPARLSLHFDLPAAYRARFCGEPAPRRADDGARASAYLERLVREIGLVGALFDRDRDVVQVSLAPGMARWFEPAQVAELLDSLGRHFHIPPRHATDVSMTIEPGHADRRTLATWAAAGFNRIGYGVGSRPGGLAAAGTGLASELQAVVEYSRDAGFGNVRLELPYGVPGQSVAAFMAMVEAAVRACPDRIGLRDCAQPGEQSTPGPGHADAPQRARMLLAGAEALEAAGYLHVGLDVFAHATDALVHAQRRQLLHRDAMGYGPHGDTDLVGFGVGAISQIGGCHARNHLQLRDWEAAIDRGAHAVHQGLQLDDDDRVRADVLQDLLCQGRINVPGLEERHGIDFRIYFAEPLEALTPLFDAGLLGWRDGGIRLGRIARLAARAVAAAFDSPPASAYASAIPMRVPG
jgi:oxygen-independent coproporphyrinogen-3 oxidase